MSKDVANESPNPAPKRGTASASPWWQSQRPRFRDVTFGGVHARYSCRGSGPPLLLLASPLVRARTYDRAAAALSRSFTVVCVELPGAGGSGRLREPWTTRRYAEWSLELIRHLPLAAPTIVGHGEAAPIAAELARIALDEIGGVVLVDAPGALSAFQPRALPDMILNAFRHRGAFIEHVKNAYSCTALHAAPQLPVPSLLATHAAGVFQPGVADSEPFTAAIRRLIASVRRGAHGLPVKAPVFAT